MQIQIVLQINVRVSGVLKHPLVWETNPQLLKIDQMCRNIKVHNVPERGPRYLYLYHLDFYGIELPKKAN